MAPFMSIPGLGGPQPSFAKGAGAGEATFSLKYFMHGPEIGTWRMYWSDGDYGTGTLTTLQYTAPSDGGLVYFLSGEKQTSGTQAWRSATVDLSPFWGTSGRLVFLYIKNSTGWQGDIAWDTQLLTINGVSTGYTASNKWRCTDPGQTYSNVSTSMAAWAAGTAGTESTISTSSNTVPGVLDLGGRTSSNSTATGPSDGDGGGAYLYIETSNISSINMYSSSRYCFFYTTEITLT